MNTRKTRSSTSLSSSHRESSGSATIVSTPVSASADNQSLTTGPSEATSSAGAVPNATLPSAPTLPEVQSPANLQGDKWTDVETGELFSSFGSFHCPGASTHKKIESYLKDEASASLRSLRPSVTLKAVKCHMTSIQKKYAETKGKMANSGSGRYVGGYGQLSEGLYKTLDTHLKTMAHLNVQASSIASAGNGIAENYQVPAAASAGPSSATHALPGSSSGVAVPPLPNPSTTPADTSAAGTLAEWPPPPSASGAGGAVARKKRAKKDTHPPLSPTGHSSSSSSSSASTSSGLLTLFEDPSHPDERHSIFSDGDSDSEEDDSDEESLAKARDASRSARSGARDKTDGRGKTSKDARTQARASQATADAATSLSKTVAKIAQSFMPQAPVEPQAPVVQPQTASERLRGLSEALTLLEGIKGRAPPEMYEKQERAIMEQCA